jgi:hypothetical protein
MLVASLGSYQPSAQKRRMYETTAEEVTNVSTKVQNWEDQAFHDGGK